MREIFLSLGVIQGKIGMPWKHAGKAIGDDVLSALPSQGCIIFLGFQGAWNRGVIWWIYRLETFYLKKPWCAKSQELEGSVFVFRKILLEMGELSLWRAQLGTNRDVTPNLWVNLVPPGSLMLQIPAANLVTELPQTQGTRWTWKLLNKQGHNHRPLCCLHCSWAAQTPERGLQHSALALFWL